MPEPTDPLKANKPERKQEYTLEDLEAEIEAGRQDRIKYYQALVDSKDMDEFEVLLPEDGKEFREYGQFVFDSAKKSARKRLESLQNESRLAFGAIFNNFTSYFPGSFYRREPFIDNPEYQKKCQDIDEVFKSMGLDLDDVTKLFAIREPSIEELNRIRDIMKRVYVEMINKGYTNEDLRN